MKSVVDTAVHDFVAYDRERPVSDNGWERVRQSQSFQELIRQKKAFIVPATIFFLAFYIALPILTAFTTVLNVKVIGAINLAYVYAFAQFIMTWGLCHLYMKKANRFDQLVENFKQEIRGKGRGAK